MRPHVGSPEGGQHGIAHEIAPRGLARRFDVIGGMRGDRRERVQEINFSLLDLSTPVVGMLRVGIDQEPIPGTAQAREGITTDQEGVIAGHAGHRLIVECEELHIGGLHLSHFAGFAVGGFVAALVAADAAFDLNIFVTLAQATSCEDFHRGGAAVRIRGGKDYEMRPVLAVLRRATGRDEATPQDDVSELD